MSVDLRTKYLGLQLSNPLVVSASPLSERIEWLKRLEDAGAAAVVLPSLFEEQVEYDEVATSDAQDFGTESFAEALSYFPEPEDYRAGPQEYLENIAKAKKAVDIPIIASLNGTSTGGWVRYAELMEQAGADAIELNICFISADVDEPSETVERRYVELVAVVRENISVPLAVKVAPYLTAMANMANRLANAGADGLVLFNRFVHPDIDLNELEMTSELVLSSPNEMLEPLRWIGILRGKVNASLALSSGLHDADGLIKALLVGADVGMIAAAVYLYGFEHVEKMLHGLQQWMEEREYKSVEQFKGSMSREHCSDPAAFTRGSYMKALVSYTGPAI